MADVREQLQRIKQENNDLEKELHCEQWRLLPPIEPHLTLSLANTNAKRKVGLLEVKVAENTDTIEQLCREHSLLAADHKDLLQHYLKASEVSKHVVSTPYQLIRRIDGQPSAEQARGLTDVSVEESQVLDTRIVWTQQACNLCTKRLVTY